MALLLLAASETQVFNLSILLGEHRVVFVCRVANKKDVSKVGWAGLEFFFDLPLWVGEVGGKGLPRGERESHGDRGGGGEARQVSWTFFSWKGDVPTACHTPLVRHQLPGIQTSWFFFFFSQDVSFKIKGSST